MFSIKPEEQMKKERDKKKKTKQRIAALRARKANVEIEVERKVTKENYEEIKEAKEKRVAVINLKNRRLKREEKDMSYKKCCKLHS